MEFNNPALIIGVGRRQMQPPSSSEHFIVEVVIMDKSNSVLNPILYRLDSVYDLENDISSIGSKDLINVDNQAFALIGEVLSIDKAKKLIYLTNNITVRYKYLIIASGIKPVQTSSRHDEELSPGIHALIDALRVRDNISHSLNFPNANYVKFDKSRKARAEVQLPTGNTLLNIERFFIPVSNLPMKALDMTISGTEKRLFEVQL